MHILEVRTSKREELVDITRRVEEVVRASGVERGICFLHVPHTTAGITINEHADPDVARDMEDTLSKLVPQCPHYRHVEGNADSHIKTSLMGCQTFVFIEKGRLLLGTWQGIFLCEFDGPRTRRVYIKILEEK